MAARQVKDGLWLELQANGRWKARPRAEQGIRGLHLWWEASHHRMRLQPDPGAANSGDTTQPLIAALGSAGQWQVRQPLVPVDGAMGEGTAVAKENGELGVEVVREPGGHAS